MNDAERIKELLRQRLAETHARIVEHPWVLAGFGLLAGVWLASHHKRDREIGAIGAVLGAVGLRFVREVALLQMARIARTWLADEPPAQPRYTH